MVRPDWDMTWMDIADVMARRSKCDGAQVGAVIVDATNRPVSTGYNGPPRNLAVSGGCSGWCSRRIAGDRGKEYGLSCPSIHAEANALMFADRRHIEGGTIYVNRAICADCAKLIANSGLVRVVMRITDEDMHRDPQKVCLFLAESGLQVEARGTGFVFVS